MAEFNLGDKVRVNSTAEALEEIWAPVGSNGLTGVVAHGDELGVDVRFEEEIEGSTLWSFTNDMVEKIDVA